MDTEMELNNFSLLEGDEKKDEESQSSTTKEETAKPTSTLLYKVSENPSIATTVLLALQHYLLTIGGNVANPLIIARAMCMFETDEGLMGRATMLSTILLISGVTTFLQTSVGIRLPTMQGTASVFIAASYAFLEMPHNQCPDPILDTGINGTKVMYNDTDGSIVDGTELWQRRMREIQGGMIVGSVVEIVLGLTGCVGIISQYIGPLSISSAIITIALSLIKVAYKYSSTHWGLAVGTMLVLIICSQYFGHVTISLPAKKVKGRTDRVRLPIFKLFPVLFAVIFGCALSFILTSTNMLTNDPSLPQYRARSDGRIGVLHNTYWFRIPYPLQFGVPTFTFAGIIAMLTGVVGSIADSLGDYFACAQIVEAGHPPEHAVNRGIVLEGIGCVFNGLMGTPGGTTTYSSNSGAIAVTRVASRRAFQCAGIIMVFLGIFGKFGGVLVMIPDPVLGGVMTVVLAMVLAVGLSNLQGVNLQSPRNMFILGFSIFTAMMLSVYIKGNTHVIDTGVKEVDQGLIIFLSMSMLTAALFSAFFDYTLPGRVPFNTEKEGERKVIDDVYDLPFRTNFKYAKYIPFLPEYKKSI